MTQTFVLQTEGDANRLWGVLGKWKQEASNKTPIAVSVHPFSFKPTKAQTARYWIMLKEIAELADVDGRTYQKDYWHIFFKKQFIGGKSTQGLNSTQFEQYIASVRMFALYDLEITFDENN